MYQFLTLKCACQAAHWISISGSLSEASAPIYSMCKQWWFRWDCTGVQSHLNHHCLHISRAALLYDVSKLFLFYFSTYFWLVSCVERAAANMSFSCEAATISGVDLTGTALEISPTTRQQCESKSLFLFITEL